MSQENSDVLRMIEAELFVDDDNVGGNPPPQPQPDWDMEKMLELIAGDVGGHQPLQPQPQSNLHSDKWNMTEQLDNQPPRSWNDNKENTKKRRRRRRRRSEEQSDSAMMNPWDIRDPYDMIDFDADDEAPQFQFECPPLPEPVWNGDENNVGEPCAMDVSGNQPPQPVIDECFPEAMKRTEHYWGSPLSLQSRPQPCAMDVSGNEPPQPVIDECFPEVMKRTEHYWGSPLSGSQPLQSQSQSQSRAIDVCGNQPLQSQSQTDIVRTLTDEFFADTCGYPPPQPQPQTQWDTSRNMLELIPDVGGHQPLQPQASVWTWEENKAFESIITSCFQDDIQNRWEAVAARLPGRTPTQLQERFQKLMNDINTMTIMMEHNPLSIPINATTPPPPSHPYSTHHHHREELVPAAEEEVVPTEQEEAAPTKTGYHWTEDEHRYLLLYYFFLPLIYLFIYYLVEYWYLQKKNEATSIKI
ncbi:Transcription factor DIVARICATA [Arachis hypogaea]|nr:Transcription factor DIVARICATA [Arachis hypogaea]